MINLTNTRSNSLRCGFRKPHSTQHAAFRLLQEWQNKLDKSGFVGTILMVLFKFYHCLPHDLLITKYEAYGIGKLGWNLLLSSLSNRKQRTKLNSSYNDWLFQYTLVCWSVYVYFRSTVSLFLVNEIGKEDWTRKLKLKTVKHLTFFGFFNVTW